MRIESNVLLTPYTNFRIGGPAKYFAKAKSVGDVPALCRWAQKKNLPTFVLGSGTNLLVSDSGFNGLVIKPVFSELKISGQRACSGAGLLLSKLINRVSNEGLSGLEWASGIPGTVGGAVCGNAGAFGSSLSDYIRSVKVFDLKDFSVYDLDRNDCDFSYRNSVFSNSNLIILGVNFIFKKRNTDSIKKEIQKILEKRSYLSTLGKHSAGCFFKNVSWKRKDIDKEALLKNFPELKRFADKEKISIGFLIDNLSLKGKKIGGAFVSDKHANFILNSGNAKAEEVLMLSSFVKHKIFSHYGFSPEEEVRLIGF